jgi:lysyl-tRNA synthetase class 2
VEVARTHSLAEIRTAYPDLPADTETGDAVGVAGRVVFARNSGKLCFATLQEGDGTQLQAMISLAQVGQDALDRWKSDVDRATSSSSTARISSATRRTVCACRFLANHFQGASAASCGL